MGGKASGRKPNPSVLKLVTNNPGKRPLNKKEPKPKKADPFAPPKFLKGEALALWRRKAPGLIQIGLLTEADVELFSVYCETWELYQIAKEDLYKLVRKHGGNAMVMKTHNKVLIQNPLVGVVNKYAEQLKKLSSEFGFTPSSRTGIQV